VLCKPREQCARTREQTRSHARAGRWFEFIMKLCLSSEYDLPDWPILRNFALRVSPFTCVDAMRRGDECGDAELRNLLSY